MPAIFPLLEQALDLCPVAPFGLPVFRYNSLKYAIYYAPGYTVVVDSGSAEMFALLLDELGRTENIAQSTNRRQEISQAGSPGEFRKQGKELLSRAVGAVDEFRRRQEEPFLPECLTLYVNNECNLRCVYCHTEPIFTSGPRLDLNSVTGAAEMVAAGCRMKARPFNVVFHGGGEPTLQRNLVDRLLDLVAKIASDFGLNLFRYVATNGVLIDEKASWVARSFDLVGLSCDGPPEIQNRQRPLADGRATSHIVERTGKILRDEGCRFHIRTTITPESLHRQAEIADYICSKFAPEEIHFEPMYISHKAPNAIPSQRAEEFVAEFMKAQRIASEHKILLMFSGSRPSVVHGPYCNVLRSVLNLVPGGLATGCFKHSYPNQVAKKFLAVGSLNDSTGRYECDQNHIQELIRRLDSIPVRCQNCFNYYHCTRGCPDICLISDKGENNCAVSAMSFRCQVQKAYTFAVIKSTAGRLWKNLCADKNSQQYIAGGIIESLS